MKTGERITRTLQVIVEWEVQTDPYSGAAQEPRLVPIRARTPDSTWKPLKISDLVLLNLQ